MLFRKIAPIVLLGGFILASYSVNQVQAATSADTSSNSQSVALADSSDMLSSSSSSSSSSKEAKTVKEETKSDEATVYADSTLGPGYYGTTRQATQSFSPMLRSKLRSNLLVRGNYVDDFLNQIKQGTINTWTTHRVLPSISAAQAILESAWGQSTLATSAHNLFGIKGDYNGQYVIMKTQEYINGQYIYIDAPFRKYPDVASSIADHGTFLNVNSRYSNLLGVTDYKTVAQLLQADGYATAPTYAESLIRIIEQYHLYDWDKESFNQGKYGSLDRFDTLNGQFNAFGWSIDSDSAGKPYSYVFALDAKNNNEIARWPISRWNRPDVGNTYPTISGSSNSGFGIFADMPASLFGKQVKLMVRYSSDARGNYGSVDYNFDNVLNIPTQGTLGSLDVLRQQGNSVYAFGWHIGRYIQSTPYRFMFIMDAKTHTEIERTRIDNFTRNDVAKAYPDFSNGNLGGFNVSMPITDKMRGKTVYTIVRYTDDFRGNGNTIDYSSPTQITIK